MRSLFAGPATWIVIVVSALAFMVLAALAGDYAVASWRADQAVSRSEQVLCGIVNLVTATPLQPPSDPASNPSRVTSYRFYQAFVIVGREYRCQEGRP